MESIKESIYKTKNALADWNIISKNDNKIEIEDTISNTPQSISKKSSNTENIGEVSKLSNSIQTENITSDITSKNKKIITENNEIIKKCQMIDDMFLKIEKMESKIDDLEKKIKETENQQQMLKLSKDTLDNLNESNEDINTTMIQHTTPIGLKYLSYTHSIYPNYSNNLLFNHYTFTPSSLDILQNLPVKSEAVTQQIEMDKSKKEKKWSFLGMKIL